MSNEKCGNMKRGTPKTIGYIRVSTIEQSTEKNENAIYRFAKNHGFEMPDIISEKVSGTTSWKNRKLKGVVDNLNSGDVLIVPELSRLGRSLVEILQLLSLLKDMEVKVFSVKENFQLNGDDMQSKVMRTMLGLFAEIERDLISARTKEGIAAARASGKQLGRPKGSGKSRLDVHRSDIVGLIENGAKRSFIAERFAVSPATLWGWLKKHELDTLKARP